MSDPLTFVDAIGRVGLPTVAAAIMLWLFVRSQASQEKLVDRLFQQVIHGDGNGAPSISRVLERQDQIDTRVTRVEAEVVQLRREHDANSKRCQPLRRAGAGGDG